MPENCSLRYLLDTNIVSDLIRNPHGRVTQRIAEVGEFTVCIDQIVAGEIRFGLAKRASERLSKQGEQVLNALEILPLESPIDTSYAEVRLALEAAGTLIGPNDLWIAAHASSRNLTLVTDNDSEFRRVRGLRVENWI